jgi:ankyrin repeat protein
VKIGENYAATNNAVSHAFSLLLEIVEAVSILVELGANVNAKNNLTGASPLHMVAQSHKATIDSRLKVAEILLKAGALLDQPDKYGSFPVNLLEASTQGIELDEKTKLLLAKLRPRQPPIHQAIIDRDSSSFETLLSDNALDVNQTFKNATPLSLAIHTFLEDINNTEDIHIHNDMNVIEKMLAMIKMLLTRGADPNCMIVESTTDTVEDIVQEPALHKLICTLRKSCNLNQEHELAKQKGVMLHTVIDLLITSGSTIPSDTILLLHQAARLNECSFATFLLDKLHIDPNTKGRQGMTPLHFAARSGKLEMLVRTFV